ncbi:MAG: GDP-mannose 4,6-dehydratase [Phycisphaerae bacterium]|nr:GDP-mannose 4,6-dehydratase [Phycisphaerae bacterium]
MRVLITGCAGFIGYHLTEHYLRAGHDVVGIDNLASGSNRNIEALQAAYPQFVYHTHDITTPISLPGPFNLVCNLACPASPIDFDPLRLEILAVCSRGVWNLLDFARTHRATLLHTSTSEVYGDPREHPQRESYWGNVNPIGPRSCYDEGKRFAEALTTAYAARFGVPVRMARIFNTYGPRMRANDGRALPNFINQALRNEPLTLHGDGSQTRSFCYISDQVEGLSRLAASNVVGPVNIGNPVEITMTQLAKEVVELCNSRSEIRHAPRPGDDPSVRRPDITRAQRELGWSPTVDRLTGLTRTIEWFREVARAG